MEVVNKRDKDISWIFKWVIAGFILSFIDIKFEIISSIISFLIVNMLDLVLKATPYQVFALKYILNVIILRNVLF